MTNSTNRPDMPVASFCTACGTGLIATAAVCPNCGTAVANRNVSSAPTAGRKDKTSAVLLAVFLGFWTWLYTYRDNAAKFWTVLGVQTFYFLIWFVVAIAEFNDPFTDGSAAAGATVVGWFISLGFWLWAVLDVSTKPRDYYENYGSR